ncbi:GNAT family N-acetyltransferase [Nocardioides limicola]|uniref:GNAT family N-acetyltransferase n=1 Tax=Nocardioides limicola TaxID=2803368 RepID=UPI00193BD603|nr:GNAT family N-acetyltransferase [Nocardioides sp. DJM-14]
MDFQVRPADVFADVAAVIGPRRPDANVCWCLSYRIPSALNRELIGPARGEYVRQLCAGPLAPGVLAYDGDTPVGWAGVAPRAELNSFARANSKIPHLDDEPVWSVWCFHTRGGHRGRGITHALLAGAVEHATACGAEIIEGYPVDNQGESVHKTMAYVGTRALFEGAGFTKAADAGFEFSGFPRLVMRRHSSAPR